MNDLQLKIFTVIKAIIQIDDFDEYYKDHTIRYGVMNYVAKYSLANNKYLITQRCLDHLNQNRFLNHNGLRRGLKSRKNGFTYEHPIPSNRISKEIINERNDIKMVERILKWSDHIVVLTKEEDDSIKKAGFQSKMPEDWTFFEDDVFARYKYSEILKEASFTEIDVYGQVCR